MERYKNTSISIIMPTYNEGRLIAFVIAELKKLFRHFPNIEIIVVDSSSIDGTAEIVTELSKKYPNIKVYSHAKRAYGAALLEGIKHAQGDVIVTFDADGDFDPMDIPRLIQPLLTGQADLVLGSRYLGKIRKGSISFWHKLNDKILSLLIRVLFRIKISDAQTTLKAIEKETLLRLNPVASDFSIHTELLAKAAKLNFAIKEVPVTYRQRLVKYRFFGSGFGNTLCTLFKVIRKTHR